MANIRKNINIDNKDLWYLVGLITSDGCLSKDGRHIDITSKDHQFLKELKDRLNLTNKIGIKNRGMHNQAYKIQISNRNFYDFLLSIGLMPNKSLILGALTIPSPFFADFLRGLVDGDGCIRNWIHSSNKKYNRIFIKSKRKNS